jgi:hypothetical protein
MPGSERAQLREGLATTQRRGAEVCPCRHLTKLRGRAEVPNGAEGAQFLSARGAKPQAHHGPLQRLLAVLIATSLGREGILA